MKFLSSITRIRKIYFILKNIHPKSWQNNQENSVLIRKYMEDLGPLFVKLGQALSTRPDIIPAQLALELTKLQDKVKPFASDIAISAIENAYQKEISELFLEFDPIPLASASMAQVHTAKLHNNQNVIIKILRPNIQNIIKKDLSILKKISKLAEKFIKRLRLLKPLKIIEELEKSLNSELDMRTEAANASFLKNNFKDSKLLYIPEIYWDYVRPNILVMEKIDAIPILDLEAIKDYNIDTKQLAQIGLEVFFTQVFRDGFFHADMHPGNIFISKHKMQYIFVDFGIVGSLNDFDKRYIAENLLAFFNRDYKRIAKLHIESGWVPKDTDLLAFEQAIRTVGEPIFEKPLSQISFANLIMQLIQIARLFKMDIQPQLILLQKTLLATEGLSRQLYPELDLWENAKPYLSKWINSQIGPKAFFTNMKDNIPYLVEKLPSLPKLIHDTLEDMKIYINNKIGS